MKYLFSLHIFIIYLFGNPINIKEKYFIDTNNTMTLQQILENKNNFQTMRKYNFGFSKDTFWMQLYLENKTDSKIIQRLFNKRAGLDFVDVYVLSNNRLIQTYSLGDMREYAVRDNIFRLSYFDITFEPNESVEVYIKQYGNSNMDIHWEVRDLDSFISRANNQSMVYFLITGVLVVATLASFLFYFILKKKYYLIYALLTFFSIGYQLGVAGFFYEFHMPIYLNTVIVYVFPYFALIFLGLFPISFFDLKKDEYKVSVLLLKLLILCLFFVVGANLMYQFLDNVLYYTKYTNIMNSIVMLILLLISIRAYKDNKKGAIFYLMSNMVLVTSILYFNFGLQGLIENNDFSYYSLAIGSISQDVFLALALIHATYLIKKENEKNSELLTEYSKLTFIGQTMINISHQWKTPINNIYNNINHIQIAREFKDPDIDNILDKNLKNIKETLSYLKDTVISQLDFYKSNAKKERINLYDEIEFVIRLIELEFSKKAIAIHLDFDKNLELNIEKNYFLNVLMVLFENSYKLFDQRKIENPFIKIEASNHENVFKFRFQDNAQGANDDIDKIFDKSYSLSHSSGLGLYLAREIIVHKLKGTIFGENKDEGILFIIDIPIVISG